MENNRSTTSSPLSSVDGRLIIPSVGDENTNIRDQDQTSQRNPSMGGSSTSSAGLTVIPPVSPKNTSSLENQLHVDHITSNQNTSSQSDTTGEKDLKTRQNILESETSEYIIPPQMGDSPTHDMDLASLNGEVCELLIPHLVTNDGDTESLTPDLMMNP
ncbi:hypothetical protein SK128_018937 [Halocaridina rubra]|uniref:Uncharacterized protein n=1 Tax=Halocaridina rubra TaxID=373956 RepID=A0AAN8WZG7_HALRR